MTTTKERIAAALRLAERDEESIPLGTTIRMRELTRAQLRDASAFATTEDALVLERRRGAQLAAAVETADGDAAAIARALTVYALGAPLSATDADRWHAALLAAGAYDGETGEALFTRDEILTWPNRTDLWDEVRRLAQAVLDLSEVGAAPLKSGDSEAPPE